MSIVGPTYNLVMSIVLSIAGFVLCCYVGMYWYEGRIAATWPTAKGVVIESNYSGNPLGDSRNLPRIGAFKVFANIEYRYVVDGNAYQSNNIFASDSYFFAHGKKKAQELCRKFKKGQEISVSYAPENPGRSVIELGIHPNAFGAGLFGAILFVGGVFGVVRVRNETRH